ncbi:16S rRNA (guanine(966)-N(2))-methyltransferase RsmD [Parvibaculum sp.]|uniref:16S rRNA (guanine(966)-N(2))-methyltransferase RsmD n=1 Tax=Parvibaculum sp. TaxID=2024848 RepID=UPI002C440C63|nr:16S rRNA (guanine(966)-N(2))-methyltransferase RsmD [Parvibaculum sp.]HUD49950.1 16S rRNA (guanine(966)-N(2))-methyltransferase RsmD [Parvibaculum sp.]
MRIVGGAHKGRAIAAPPGHNVRPTSDRVREALFNILAHADFGSFDLEGARVLDLFAGTGALGLEAISRGASFALFVEEDADARGAIRENMEALGLTGHAKIYKRDATALGPRPGSVGPAFSLVFLDPPYGKGLAERALLSARDGGWVEPDALFVVEEAASSKFAAPEGFEELDRRKYGIAEVVFLKLAGEAED